MTTELLLAVGHPRRLPAHQHCPAAESPQDPAALSAATQRPQSNRLEHNGGTFYWSGGTAVGDESVSPSAFNIQNLRGQSLLFRCLETGFVTTAPALGRYQRGRGIDPSRRELVGERPAKWTRQVPSTTCEHCGMVVKGTQWAFRQHQQSKRCLKAQQAA